MEVEALVRGVAVVADHLAMDHPDRVEDLEVEDLEVVDPEEIPIATINRQTADHTPPHLAVRGAPVVAEAAAMILATQLSSMTP